MGYDSKRDAGRIECSGVVSAKGFLVNETERKSQLLKLWHRRPPEKRTHIDILSFYGWVEVNRPDLLLRRDGIHPFKHFEEDLSAHVPSAAGSRSAPSVAR